MERLWRTDGDYCMLLLRLAVGAILGAHGAWLAFALRHVPALSWTGAFLEFSAAMALLAGVLARLSAGALLFDAAAGLAAFGNAAPGRGAAFYVLAGALLWTVIVHGAGPYSVDSWLTRHLSVKRL